MGVFVTLYNYLGYHLLAPPYHLSQTVVGLIFSVYLVGTFSSAWMGQQATRYGRGRILSISFALIGAGIALLAMPWLSTMALGIALVTFGFFGGHSVASSWAGSRAGTMRAEASALYLFAYYLGSSVLGGGWPGLRGLGLAGRVRVRCRADPDRGGIVRAQQRARSRSPRDPPRTVVPAAGRQPHIAGMPASGRHYPDGLHFTLRRTPRAAARRSCGSAA